MPKVQYSNNLDQLWRVLEPYGRLTKLTPILKGMFPPEKMVNVITLILILSS